MLGHIKRGTRKVLGPRLTTLMKRWLAAAAPAAAPPAPPADPPRRVLFLSDCHARDEVWGPFQHTMLAYCGAAFGRVLAVRANAFFHNWSHRPYSEGHIACLESHVRAFAPDLVFSTNRAGLAGRVLAALHPDVKVLTAFVDDYDRLDDEMHRYGPRDLVWGTGTGRFQRDFLRRHAGRLRPEQTVFTAWGVDHNMFYPRRVGRTAGVVFVGTSYSPHDFIDLMDLLGDDEGNRRAFLEAYAAYREQVIFDWPAALRDRGFDYGRLAPEAARRFEHASVHRAVGDQVSIEKRATCLAALAGLDVKVYGSRNREWVQAFSLTDGRMLKDFQFRAVFDPEELIKLYCSARIGVNIQHDHARDTGLSFRVYDLLACETLLLTHGDARWALGDLGLVEDEDYVAFDEPAELRRKCEYYLAHEEQRRAIAESGARKLRARHTLAHRLAHVYGTFGYREQAEVYERLSRADAPLDAGRILRDKVTTLHALAAPAAA